MRYRSNTSAYSVIIALFVMSFLLILTTGIFRLVVSELVQNRSNSWYLQAYGWAEAARELALLHIKQQWYGAYDQIDHTLNNRSILLSDYPNDIWLFKKQKDVYISYDLGYKVTQYDAVLAPLWYDIIPLYSDDINIDDLSLEIVSGNSSRVLWNIIASNWGLAGSGPFTMATAAKQKIVNNSVLSFWDISVWDFLESSDDIVGNQNYVFIFNGGDQNLKYKLVSGNNKAFTTPQTQIISSGQVWKFRQNLQTSVDNTKFLWILRYSVFSPNTWVWVGWQ